MKKIKPQFEMNNNKKILLHFMKQKNTKLYRKHGVWFMDINLSRKTENWTNVPMRIDPRDVYELSKDGLISVSEYK